MNIYPKKRQKQMRQKLISLIMYIILPFRPPYFKTNLINTVQAVSGKIKNVFSLDTAHEVIYYN
jgi:hypothetical protein